MIPGGPFGGDGNFTTLPEGGPLWDYTTAYMLPSWITLRPGPPSPSGLPPAAVQFSPALTITAPALTGLGWELAAWALRLTEMANLALSGKLNATLDFTVTPNADSTTIIDVRIGVTSFLQWMPKNPAAATEIAAGGMYVKSQNNGQATVAHSNSGTPNRYFRLLIIG